MDVVDVARQFKCDEEADKENWVTAMEGMGFHLRLDRLHYLRHIARHCFVVYSGAISEKIGTVINRLAIEPLNGLENQRLPFCHCFCEHFLKIRV